MRHAAVQMEGRAAARFVFFFVHGARSVPPISQSSPSEPEVKMTPCRESLDPIAQVACHAASSYPSIGLPREGMALGNYQRTVQAPHCPHIHNETGAQSQGLVAGARSSCDPPKVCSVVSVKESGIHHEIQGMGNVVRQDFPVSNHEPRVSSRTNMVGAT